MCALAAIAVLASGCDRSAPHSPGSLTPEAAVRQFVQRLAEDDLDGAMQLADPDNVAARAEILVAARLRVLSKGSANTTPSKVRALARIAGINVAGQLAEATVRFVYQLLLDEKYELLEATDANIAAFVRTVDPTRLKALQIVRIDPPVPTVMNRESELAEARQQAAARGADDRTERIALLQFDGKHFVGAFTLFHYGTAWRIGQLESLYAWRHSAARVGREPISRTTPQIYDELVK